VTKPTIDERLRVHPAGRVRPAVSSSALVLVRESIIMLRTVTRHAVRFVRAEDGPTAVEYAVMLALIIVVCIGAITTLGGNAQATFTNVALNGTLTGS
jgi:pilus assembly protein Flp/PilA